MAISQVQEVRNEIQAYIENPKGVLHIGGVRVGRIKYDDVRVVGKDAAATFLDVLYKSCEQTKRESYKGQSAERRDLGTLPVTQPGRLLSAESEDFIASAVFRKLASDGILAKRRTLLLLKVVTGDVPVASITHKHIAELWNLLRWLPKISTAELGTMTLNAHDLIAQGRIQNVPGISDNTYRSVEIDLASFFTWLVKCRAIGFSPLEGFTRPKSSSDVQKAKVLRLLSPSELSRIFDPSTFVPWASKVPHMWWGPILGLYTGARVNEISQLKLSDIVLVEGRACISLQVTADEDLVNSAERQSRQSIKNKSSIRTIPLAQPLLDAGFMDYVQDVRDFGHLRLFPHLSAGVARGTGEIVGRYGMGMTKAVSARFRSLGHPRWCEFSCISPYPGYGAGCKGGGAGAHITHHGPHGGLEGGWYRYLPTSRVA